MAGVLAINHVNVAADIFYVRDLEGQKVENERKTSRIIETLNKKLGC